MSSTPTDSLAALIDAVEALTGTSADRIGAPDTGRAAVVSTYGATSVYADDSNLVNAVKVQIDVYITDPADGLPEAVMAVLEAMYLPYRVEDWNGYDPETNRLRTILQLEVL